MGNFHPHGDQAIYDALVRLAQDFSSRYPLVDGQGNFGNIDGDNPAAYRYTEARLTEVARLLLDGIDEDAVDFRPNYDGADEEPVVLPAAFPNLLANGSQGIAVGMATSIPPHNAAELCDAALHLIENPNARSQDAAEIRAGSGFPDRRHRRRSAGGDRRGLYAPGAARSACARAGRRRTPGAAPIRSSSPKSPGWCRSRGWSSSIAELINEKKLPLVADVRDESAEDVRLVIEPRARTVDPALMMESLFKLTELESRIPLNMNVLVKGRIPKVIGACRGAARMARPPPRRAGAPLALPARGRSSTGWKCWAAI